MADDSMKVKVRPVHICKEHGTGVVAVQDASGKTQLRPILREDHPDVPEGAPLLCDFGRPDESGWQSATISRRGPPKVNSDAYRKGWERIFGNKTTEGEA